MLTLQDLSPLPSRQERFQDIVLRLHIISCLSCQTGRQTWQPQANHGLSQNDSGRTCQRERVLNFRGPQKGILLWCAYGHPKELIDA